MDKMNFIKTSDVETAILLRSQGFMCIGEANNVWTFLNNVNLTFSEDVNKDHIQYSNMLSV